MTPLKGKTLFVSGGSRGIGLAIALRAARDGANVAIAAKTAEPHPKLKGTIYTAADEVRAAGGKALPILCDIRDEAQVMAAIAILAPSRAARSAIASPMPRLPPDTNKVLPLSDVMFSSLRRIRPAVPPALLPRGFRATGTRVGGAEQSIRGHRD